MTTPPSSSPTLRCPGAITRATPAYFINETIPLVKDSKLKAMLVRYAAMPGLTYQDVAIIFMQVLPTSVFDAWPSVTLQPPLDIPAMSSFNNNFSREWWYFNANGHVHDVKGDKKGAASRFYMLRVMKRFRTKYPSGTENVPWILHDTVSIFIDDGMHYSNSVCAPCYSHLDKSVVYPCFLVSGPDPAQVLYYEDSNNYQTSLKMTNGILVSKFTPKNDVSFAITCKCSKSVLLQGPDLNGLDPGSNDIVSKVSGASYLYYSFPSWSLDTPSGLEIIDPKANKKYQGDQSSFQLWLDHQGGTVKAPSNKLIGELAITIGARPLVFPGWNWFSIQFNDNTQFTGYSNKPWDNNTSNNKQMLKGSWFSKDGKLSWISGSLTVDKWWRSPDSGTPFGTEYTFYLGEKGTFTLKGIMNDQRTMEGGIENYEGGCDVYQGDKLVGVGNLECVGWPSIDERVKFISKSLSSPLTSTEVATVESILTPDMTRMKALVIFVWILIGILLTVPLVLYVKRRWGNWYGALGIPVTLAIAALVVWLILKLVRHLMCQKLKTCAIDYPSSGCLFNCKG